MKEGMKGKKDEERGEKGDTDGQKEAATIGRGRERKKKRVIGCDKGREDMQKTMERDECERERCDAYEIE